MYNYHISYLVNRVDKSQFLRVPSTALLKLSHVLLEQKYGKDEYFITLISTHLNKCTCVHVHQPIVFKNN